MSKLNVAHVRCVWNYFVSSAYVVLVAFTALQAAHAAPATLEGRVDVVVEDHAHGGHVRHTLVTANRARIELRYPKGRIPNLKHGAKVRVRGQIQGQVLALDDASGAFAVTAAAAPTNTLGEQRVAVVLVNFSNDTREPYTTPHAHDVVFTQTSNFLRENSYQRTWLAGATLGWYTLPIARTCHNGEIATHARAAAAARGVDLANYARVIYAFPHNSDCGWSGLGSVGGATSEAWINGPLHLKVVAHELGHNLGLWHSHALDCDTSALGLNCTSIDYGDTADVMGNINASHFNAFQKEQLGWLAPAASNSVLTVTTSGSYTITAYASGSGGLKALRVPCGVDTASGAPRSCYVEYRSPTGFDAVLASQYGSNLTSGLIVRRAIAGDGNSSEMLDMTPGTIPTFDHGDAALVGGQVFNDAQAGVSIQLVSATANAAIVQVNLGATASCVRAAPQIALSTSNTSGIAGASASVGISVTNRDSAACAAAPMSLVGVAPAGWSLQFAPSTAILAPGASATSTLSFTPPQSASAGSHAIGATVIHGAQGDLRASATATHTVIATSVSATMATDKPHYARNETVRLVAHVHANGRAVAGAAVAFRLTRPNGSVAQIAAVSDANGMAQASYRVARKDPTGLWAAQADAAVAGNAARASASFSVR